MSLLMCPAMIFLVITNEQTLVNKNSRQPDDHLLTPENSIKPLVVSQQLSLTRLSKGYKSQTDCSSSSSPILDIGNEIGVSNYHPASDDLASSQYEFWNDYDQADLDAFDEIDAQPSHHGSVSLKRPLPPVPPNQIGSDRLLRLATYLSGFYQSTHPTSFTGSNQSDSNTQNLNKQALPSPKPLEPKRINSDNSFELLIENLPIPLIITEEENLDNVPKLVIPDKCDDDESISQEREKATEESLSRLEYLNTGITSTKEVQKEARKDYYHCSFLKRIKSQEFISYFGEKLKFMEKKKEWNVWFEKYLRQLDEKKPIVWGGYTQDEIDGLMRQLNPKPDQSGEQKRLIDVWGHLNPDFEGILGL
ncbi:hypothetical protein PPACK8108_LOCUS4901 [Phakopsora pachyrhizi]|uniref:Secreted protein n=1 Tax=Phakopsora pachyrhizi TaxID=170000 RepID=A0AAV0APU7_PHAPC|nr:hypothetical protein PPACK8108_LOCUS4901 [Phakopsora pachyrhizi]